MARLYDFLAPNSPAAARHAASVILGVADHVAENPAISVPRAEFREWFAPFGRSAYVLRYAILDGGDVIVTPVWHSREHRTNWSQVVAVWWRPPVGVVVRCRLCAVVGARLFVFFVPLDAHLVQLQFVLEHVQLEHLSSPFGYRAFAFHPVSHRSGGSLEHLADVLDRLPAR